VDGTEIVTALQERDPAGLAAAYDAYADRLFSYCTGMLRDRDAAADAVHDTFVIAYERAGQLRDPDRLRPWLYAIARNECLRVIRSRGRTTALDEAVAVSDTTADLTSGLRDEELRRLVWAAAEGLNPREREVLDLAVRHDLDPAEVARALGVPAKHAHALLSKARQQLQRAIGALIVARTGRADCAELDGLLSGWDGGLTVLLRKRVSRHIDSCGRCGERQRRDVSAQALFAATPLLVAPAALRDRVLATGSASEFGAERAEIGARAGRFDRAGFPVPLDGDGRPGRLRPAPAVAALSIAAVVIGGTFLVDQRLGGTVVDVPPAPAVSPSTADVVEPLVDETPTETAPSPTTPAGQTSTLPDPVRTAPPPDRPPGRSTPTRTPTPPEPAPTLTEVTPTREPTLPTVVPLPPVIIGPPESTTDPRPRPIP